MHRSSASRPIRQPVRIIGSYISAAFAVMANKQKALAELYKDKANWVAPSFKRPDTNKYKPHQSTRGCARRVRQLAAGIIHLN